MNGRVIAGVMALAVAAMSCRQVDVRMAAIHVPAMKNQACANLIIRALGQDQGIPASQIKADVATRTVEVRYDSVKQSLKNLEFAVADIGFEANDVPANAEAEQKLPADCR